MRTNKLLIALLWVRFLQADEDIRGWNLWFSEGLTAETSGQYSAAIVSFRQALAAAKQVNLDQRRLVELNDRLAAAYVEASQPIEALGEYKRVLDMVKALEGRQSLDYAIVLGSLDLLPGQLVNSETVRTMETALRVHRPNTSPEKLASFHSCFAKILLKQARYSEAERVLLDLQADLKRLEFPNLKMAATLASEFGLLRFQQGRHKEAVDFDLESLRMREVLYGREHPSLINPLNNLATEYVKLGRLQESEMLYQRAIQICKTTLRNDPAIYSVLLRNCAFVLRGLGRKRDAKTMEVESRKIDLAFRRRTGTGSTISLDSFRTSPQ